MGCNFKNANNNLVPRAFSQELCQKWKKHAENIQMAKFKAPGIKEWDFMTVWSFKKLRRFVWRKLLESKALLPSIISKNSNWRINLLFNARDFELGNFDVFDILFPFLAFFKL